MANKRSNSVKNPEMRDVLGGMTRTFLLGAPIVATDDYIVASANMKVGSYTIAHQPDVPRCLTVTHAIVATGTDTLGVITVKGTNVEGKVVTEIITPSAGAVVNGLVAFKTITSVVGSGWVIAGGNDTIKVGVGTTLGLPYQIVATSEVQFAYLDGTYVAPTVVANGDISKCTIDISSGTYNGTKKARVVIA